MKQLRLLGATEIEEDGVARPFGARKYILLLALLARRPHRTFARSELVALLWPDSDENAGRAALRTALTTLRKELGTECFMTTAETVAIVPERLTTDVAQLELALEKVNRTTEGETIRRLQQEIERYHRGAFLPGRYDDWVVVERERLARAVASALDRCTTLLHLDQRNHKPPKVQEPALLWLPLFASRFMGREADLESITRLLRTTGTRLVTLMGTAGIGKTRLSVEVARVVANDYPGTVCFIPLAAVTEATDIIPMVARSLQIEMGSGDAESLLSRRLGELGKSLLILDNLEQLANVGAARAVRTLLSLSPDLQILATSRQVIGCEGEKAYPVAGLLREANHALFMEHAQAVQPAFVVTEQNRSDVDTLCDKLEGIPLAIELCATWSAVLTPHQMVNRLEKRFALLKSRRHDITERHRSLHAALEWGLPTEPALLDFFLSLAVFRNGFTLEAAETIAGEDALEALAALRERSLVIAEPQSEGAMRYRLLETIREFAEEKSEAEAICDRQRRHLAYYCQLAKTLTELLTRPQAALYFQQLERENANFRAAIEFGLTDTAESLWLAWCTNDFLSWFWHIRGHQMPRGRWFDTVFARRDELPETVLPTLLWLAASRLPEDQAEPLLQEALVLAEKGKDWGSTASVLEAFSNVAFARNDIAAMDAYARRAAEMREQAGDIQGAGYCLAELAGKYARLGEGEKARRIWARCREIGQQVGNIGTVAVIDRAEACLLFGEGHIEESFPFFERALGVFREKDETWQIMDTLHRYGDALIASDKPARALPILQEAMALATSRDDAARASIIAQSLLVL